MNEPGLPQAITAGSIVLAVFIVGNMIYRIGASGKKKKRRRLP